MKLLVTYGKSHICIGTSTLEYADLPNQHIAEKQTECHTQHFIGRIRNFAYSPVKVFFLYPHSKVPQ